MRENVINKNSTDEGRIKKNRMDEVAVLIPCYNESKTIEKVVTDFRRELPDAVIYVYDNNSTDNTVEIAKQAYYRQNWSFAVIILLFRLRGIIIC